MNPWLAGYIGAAIGAAIGFLTAGLLAGAKRGDAHLEVAMPTVALACRDCGGPSDLWEDACPLCGGKIEPIEVAA